MAICSFAVYGVNCNVEKHQDVLVPGSSLFCEGCYGTVDILLQEFQANKEDNIRGPYRMDDKWKDFENKMCRTDNLKKYVYSPPKMTKVNRFV